MTQLLVFGHSITHGYWDTEGGWVQRLRTFLDERALEEQDEELVYYVYELGVGGDTTEDLLERLEPELEARYDSEGENIVMLQIGGNDFMVVEGEKQLTEEEFRQNLEIIIEKIREHTDKIMLVGDGYIGIEGEIPYDPGREVSDKHEKRAHEIRKEVASQKDVPYLSIRENFEKEQWLEHLEEGIHPTNEGHRSIYEKVREKLEEESLI